MAARLATVSRTRARGRDRCLGTQQAAWDSIPTKSCGEDFLSSSLPDLAITGLDTGEILGAFHSYVDQTIISIIEDSSSAESKCPLDEESEATLLTALTEILDTVDDENPSPFDTLPDNELFASPKGVREGPLRVGRCSWASFPDSEKDLFKCVDAAVPQDVSWSSEKTADEDCFGVESLSDHTGDTINDIADVSKPAIEILDLQLDEQLDPVGFEDSVTLVFDQNSPCVINVEHVSLSDLVKYVHPYCLPSEDSTDSPTKAVKLDVELVQGGELLDLECPATLCESPQRPSGTPLSTAGERPVAAGDPAPDVLPHSPLGQTVVPVTSPEQEQPPAPVRKRGRPRKVSKPEERAAVGMQRGRTEGPVTRSSLRRQLQPESQDQAQPVGTKGPQIRLRARGRRDLGAEPGFRLQGGSRAGTGAVGVHPGSEGGMDSQEGAAVSADGFVSTSYVAPHSVTHPVSPLDPSPDPSPSASMVSNPPASISVPSPPSSTPPVSPPASPPKPTSFSPLASPHKPSPTVSPLASSPSVSPLTSSPSVSPLTSSPSVSPLASSPSVSPLASSPSVSPLASSPSVSPLASLPESSPTGSLLASPHKSSPTGSLLASPHKPSPSVSPLASPPKPSSSVSTLSVSVRSNPPASSSVASAPSNTPPSVPCPSLSPPASPPESSPSVSTPASPSDPSPSAYPSSVSTNSNPPASGSIASPPSVSPLSIQPPSIQAASPPTTLSPAVNEPRLRPISLEQYRQRQRAGVSSGPRDPRPASGPSPGAWPVVPITSIVQGELSVLPLDNLGSPSAPPAVPKGQGLGHRPVLLPHSQPTARWAPSPTHSPSQAPDTVSALPQAPPLHPYPGSVAGPAQMGWGQTRQAQKPSLCQTPGPGQTPSPAQMGWRQTLGLVQTGQAHTQQSLKPSPCQAPSAAQTTAPTRAGWVQTANPKLTQQGQTPSSAQTPSLGVTAVRGQVLSVQQPIAAFLPGGGPASMQAGEYTVTQGKPFHAPVPPPKGIPASMQAGVYTVTQGKPGPVPAPLPEGSPASVPLPGGNLASMQAGVYTVTPGKPNLASAPLPKGNPASVPLPQGGPASVQAGVYTVTQGQTSPVPVPLPEGNPASVQAGVHTVMQSKPNPAPAPLPAGSPALVQTVAQGKPSPAPAPLPAGSPALVQTVVQGKPSPAPAPVPAGSPALVQTVAQGKPSPAPAPLPVGSRALVHASAYTVMQTKPSPAPAPLPERSPASVQTVVQGKPSPAPAPLPAGSPALVQTVAQGKPSPAPAPLPAGSPALVQTVVQGKPSPAPAPLPVGSRALVHASAYTVMQTKPSPAPALLPERSPASVQIVAQGKPAPPALMQAGAYTVTPAKPSPAPAPLSEGNLASVSLSGGNLALVQAAVHTVTQGKPGPAPACLPKGDTASVAENSLALLHRSVPMQQQCSRTADAEEIVQQRSPSLQEVLTEDGAKGIEAADLMSLLEQFEVNEVNERPSPPGNTRVAEADGKVFLDQVIGVELAGTAGLTPPATPPYQHSPAGHQHQGGTRPLQSSPPQTLRVTEAKHPVQNKGSKCVEAQSLTGTSATHAGTHFMTTTTGVGTQSVTGTSTTYVGTQSMTGSLTTYVGAQSATVAWVARGGTQSATRASVAREDAQPVTRASVTQMDVQSGTTTLTTDEEAQPSSLTTHVGVQSMSRTVSTPAPVFGDHEYCLPSVPSGYTLPHKAISPPGMRPSVACRWNVKRQSSIIIKPITLLNHRASKVLQKQGDGSSCAVQELPRDGVPSAGAREGSRTCSRMLESGSIGPEGETWTLSPSGTEECRGEPSGSERDCNRTQSSPCYRRQYSSSSSSRSRSRSRSQSRSWSPARKRRRYYRRRSRHSRHSSRSDSRSSSRSRSFSRSNSRSTSGSRSRSRSPQRCSVRMSYFTDEFDPYDVGPRDRYHYSRRQAHEHKISRRRELAIEERRVVYVGKIRNGMMREELRRRFEVFGEIEDCNIYFRTQGDNYGFVTYRYTCDAFAAIENGQSLRRPDELPFDLCFGGRRQFCKTNYADLDSSHSDVSSYSSKSKFDSVDFDTLLKQAKRSLQR
ncbi:peroxisome proliferator-activated receptor gamma coactivator-related protein 1 isoform X2 [Hypanus sabinus]|uniref:peroxisome proliferator-activated receptor gamma coactivator-related protein 1 isoform X2 n=1 Tax=Hypanus sabinus TaxID=79690 RepID=UPI0028C4DC2E|nr:peroxisome proliferator-activated receptor gamma coactivator-related protein 1 isoform X2 [Hypanus sabinus]